MVRQTETAAEVRAIKVQLDKAKAEVVAKITNLEEVIANIPGETEPELAAAVLELKGAVQDLDDLHPDTVPTP